MSSVRANRIPKDHNIIYFIGSTGPYNKIGKRKLASEPRTVSFDQNSPYFHTELGVLDTQDEGTNLTIETTMIKVISVLDAFFLKKPSEEVIEHSSMKVKKKAAKLLHPGFTPSSTQVTRQDGEWIDYHCYMMVSEFLEIVLAKGEIPTNIAVPNRGGAKREWALARLVCFMLTYWKKLYSAEEFQGDPFEHEDEEEVDEFEAALGL